LREREREREKERERIRKNDIEIHTTTVNYLSEQHIVQYASTTNIISQKKHKSQKTTLKRKKGRKKDRKKENENKLILHGSRCIN
jgi:tRNA(Leu) C34 or U34 (ribose-2'-O)-methylase TrmL